MPIYTTKNEKETLALGKQLGKTLKGGEVLALSGDLGAGKTKFLQGLAVGLGVKSKVNSPTFNILKLYPAKRGKIRLFCHIDAYRLSSAGDLESLGFKELISRPEAVTAIEWAERVKAVIPKKSYNIDIKNVGEEKRRINIRICI